MFLVAWAYISTKKQTKIYPLEVPMKQTINHEVEKLRQEYEAWEGNQLLSKYNDSLIELLKLEKNANTISPDLAKEYVALQQEILRRLDC
jgi:hypothetical protein